MPAGSGALRVLVVSNDHVGSRMAGPGIRYYHFARELARRFDVTLLAPELPDVELDGVRTLAWRPLPVAEVEQLCRGFDVVVAQHLAPRVMRALARSPVRVVYDLYDPYVMESLAFHAATERYGPLEQIEYEAARTLQELALAAGDAFVCASERQRDLWLGMLAAQERIALERYRGDEDLRDLVDVVPFGLEPEPPHATARVLKGVVPGIEPDDRVLLWGGGIWNWLDPLTPIRAVERLAGRRPDVKLYFLGLRHPNPDIARMEMASRAVELAERLGVLDRSVFFNFGWVPYRERQNYLLEADLGISAHLDTVEARFAFRARLLDYFWARLPVVTTDGDSLSHLVGDRGVGRTVAPGDVDGWVAAIEELLGDAEAYESARQAAAGVHGELAWPALVETLARLVEAPRAAAAPGHRVEALLARHLWLHARIVLAQGGRVGLARYVAGVLAAKARSLARSPQPA